MTKCSKEQLAFSKADFEKIRIGASDSRHLGTSYPVQLVVINHSLGDRKEVLSSGGWAHALVLAAAGKTTS